MSVFDLVYFCRKKTDFGDEFRKPIWYDDESDDELFDNNKSFGFQIFTNPLELQKHYEHQMQEIIKSLADFEGEYIWGVFFCAVVKDRGWRGLV